MAYCIPRYPSDGFIRKGNQIEIDDYGDLSQIDNDTTKLFDMKEVRVSALLFNVMIQYVNLDEYPNIKNRLINDSFIEEGEMADLIFEIGDTPENINDILLNDSPVPMPIENVSNVIDRFDAEVYENIKGDSGVPSANIMFDFVESILGDDSKGNDGLFPNSDGSIDGGDTTGNEGSSDAIDGSAAGDGTSTSFDTTPGNTNTPDDGGNRLNNPDLTFSTLPVNTTNPIERIGANLNSVSRAYPSSGVGGIGANWVPSGAVRSILSRANRVYTPYDAELDSDACSFGAANPFPPLFAGLITQYVDPKVMTSGSAGVGGPANIFPNPITYIVAEIQSGISAAVDRAVSLATSAFSQAKSMYNSTLGFISNLGNNPMERVFDLLTKKYSKLSVFFSRANAEMMRRKMKEFAKIQEMQFEDLTLPLVIAILKYRACKFSSLIKSLFDSVLGEFRDFVNNIKSEFGKMSSLSGMSTNSSVNNGSNRLDPSYRYSTSNSYAERVNTRSIGSTQSGGTGYVPSSRTNVRIRPTAEELRWVAGISEGGAPDGVFRFSSSVLNMGPSATAAYNGNPSRYPEFRAVNNYGSAGWQEVISKHKEVYILLRRVIINMGRSGHKGSGYTINSAYRSPTYNRMVKGARNSAHKSAMALDVSMNGVSNNGRKDFIRYASEQGFGGIGWYDTFIHVDIAQTRTWIKGAADRSVRTTLAKHKSGDYRNGVNNIPASEPVVAENSPVGDVGTNTNLDSFALRNL